jgi:hypothetical protein
MFSPPHSLLDMPSHHARLILAVRCWFVYRKAALDPMPRIGTYLQSEIVATRFGVLMEAVAEIWPEPFGVHRPCCAIASIDERLLADAVALAWTGNMPQFHRLMCDMIPSSARDLLFSRAHRLYE